MQCIITFSGKSGNSTQHISGKVIRRVWRRKINANAMMMTTSNCWGPWCGNVKKHVARSRRMRQDQDGAAATRLANTMLFEAIKPDDAPSLEFREVCDPGMKCFGERRLFQQSLFESKHRIQVIFLREHFEMHCGAFVFCAASSSCNGFILRVVATRAPLIDVQALGSTRRLQSSDQGAAPPLKEDSVENDA